MMSGAAVILAVGIVELTLPLFNETAGKKLSLGLLANLSTIPILIGNSPPLVHAYPPPNCHFR